MSLLSLVRGLLDRISQFFWDDTFVVDNVYDYIAAKHPDPPPEAGLRPVALVPELKPVISPPVRRPRSRPAPQINLDDMYSSLVCDVMDIAVPMLRPSRRPKALQRVSFSAPYHMTPDLYWDSFIRCCRELAS